MGFNNFTLAFTWSGCPTIQKHPKNPTHFLPSPHRAGSAIGRGGHTGQHILWLLQLFHHSCAVHGLDTSWWPPTDGFKMVSTADAMRAESFQEQIQNIHHTQIGDTWHNGSKGSDKWEFLSQSCPVKHIVKIVRHRKFHISSACWYKQNHHWDFDIWQCTVKCQAFCWYTCCKCLLLSNWITSWAFKSQRNHYQNGAECRRIKPQSQSQPLGRRGPFKHLRGSTPGITDNSAKELSKRIAPWRANGRFGSPQPRYAEGCLTRNMRINNKCNFFKPGWIRYFDKPW